MNVQTLSQKVKMEFFRCQICGDVYMGKTRPSNCPYCGAMGKYLVPAREWTDENETVGVLSGVSKGNLEKALMLEVNNTPFYREASANAATMELQGIFKGLAKVENEHATLIRKILKCDMPPPDENRERATKDDNENLRMAHIREKFAAGFYRKAAVEASEPRVKKVFVALSEIENDHIQLEDELLNGHG